MQEFFLFTKKGQEMNWKNNANIEIIARFQICLNNKRLKRLLCTSKNFLDNNNDEVFDMYIVTINSIEITGLIENDNYNSDCNITISNLLNTYSQVIGTSSVYQNNIVKSLIFGENDFLKLYIENPNIIIKELVGEKTWNSLKEFFNILYLTKIKYVTLRKSECFPNSFVKDDKDIDILCENKNEFIAITNATKRSLGISGYKISINNEDIPLDIRYKGDFYFDPAWEENILINSFYNENNIAVMDKENQIFSILYHVLTQKKAISDYYLKILEFNLKTINRSELINLLILYMKSKGYYYYKPLDISVVQNKDSINKINNRIHKLKKRSKVRVWLLSKIPNKYVSKRVWENVINKE